MNKIKVIHILLTVLLTAGFILLGVFVFGNSYMRLMETVKDLYTSIVFYGATLFYIPTGTSPTVNGYSGVLTWQGYLPDSADKIKEFFGTFFSLLVDRENFTLWADGIIRVLGVILGITVLTLPVIVIGIVLIKRSYRKKNNNYDKDTVPLKVFKKIMRVSVLPVYNFMREYFGFLRDKRWVKICWLILWAGNLNVLSIAVAFFAYYFYFTVSFDMQSILIQTAKLIIDLQVAVKTIPVVLWVILGIYRWDRARKKIAINRLRYGRISYLILPV